MEHQKGYVFEAPKSNSSKKRKRDTDLDDSWHCRKRLYNQFWTRQKNIIDMILNSANEETLSKVTEFVTTTSQQEALKLPAALITAGPNIASHTALFDQLGSRLQDQGSSAYVVLHASECPNLKSLLKTLISTAVAHLEARGNAQNVASKTRKTERGSKLLNYDLELLHDHVRSQAPSGVVVAFQDTEAFDNLVLADAVDLLHLWRTRIPFILLFGIATSPQAFQDRLSRAALRGLQGEEFDVLQADQLLERVFVSTIEEEDTRLWLGPELTRMIFERQKDHVQSGADFVDAMQYAHMSHFFANRVSTWIGTEEDGKMPENVTKEDREALRALPSFQEQTSKMLDQGDKLVAHRVRHLLESDDDLRVFVKAKVREGHASLRKVWSGVRMVHKIMSRTAKADLLPISALYSRAMAGKLLNSPALREMLLLLKRADSSALKKIIEDLISSDQTLPTFIDHANSELVDLLSSNTANGPLRSEHDDRQSTMRTTIIAKKAQLSKEKSTLSKSDEVYSRLLAGFVSSVEHHLSELLSNPMELCFREVFMYDIKGPYRASFAPRTRAAIERALSSPHDYLACDCCAKTGEEGLIASQPASAVLYQLYLESGSLINTSDLYSAYAAIMGDEVEDEDRTKALFERSLAELKYLGMIRPSRKKTDHVAKTAWSGI